MRLLFEEYHSFDQLLDEMPAFDALAVGSSYFDERDESDFGDYTGSNPDTESTFNLVSRYFARKGR